MDRSLRINLLGPVHVATDTGTSSVRSRPQRIVLACLALEADRTVGTGTLIDALWPIDPPSNASGNLHSYVSKLRRLVGPDRIRRDPGGYRLIVDEEAVDALRARAVAQAAETLPSRERAEALTGVLALWHGEALADLADVDALRPERMRLAALRREIDVRRMAALVEARDYSLVLPDLREETVEEPYDESVVALLARALHGSGRTAEALGTISNFRRRVAEDTGLVVGADLLRLEERILQDDPRLRGVEHHANGRDVVVGPATSEWPRPTTRLHGREGDLARLDEVIDAERLVTLTGIGGIGKSRLVYAVADRRSVGGQVVHFLPLAHLAPDDDLAARLAAALGLRVGAQHDALRSVHERIGSGGQLLVLDNCEHVLDPVRRLLESLRMHQSDLSVVATSRTPLGLPAECVLRIGPLDEAGTAGVDLFVECARRARPELTVSSADEETIREVVRDLGGLPLAIELAAGRLGTMSLNDLAARIGDLDLLADGRPTERHRTLRASIDWSYRLLPEPTRRLLRMLSLFPGGTDLATVEEFARPLRLPTGGAAEVAALADASLVVADLGRSTRYSMLEPVRTFARERLEQAGEFASAVALRATWAQGLAAWIEDTCRSPTEGAADSRLRANLMNLRAAHRTALREGDLDTAVTISAALTRPATARDLPEVWSWASDLAAHPALAEHARCADALGAAATAAWLTGDLDEGERLANDGLRRDPASVSCLQALASVRLFLGDPESARQLWVAASRPQGAYLPQAALAAVYSGNAELARTSLAEADAWAAEVGSPTEFALCRYAWGELLAPDPAALEAYEEAISSASGVGATFVASVSRVGLASTLTSNGRFGRAVDEFETVIRYWRTTGNWTQQWTTLRNVADLLEALERRSSAAYLRAAADEAPSAAATAPHAAVGDPGGPRARPAPARESVVAVVLAELADVRRETGSGSRLAR